MPSFGQNSTWEVRPAGSAANGGGYSTGALVPSPGTDYSQQDSAQVTYTDLVIDGTSAWLVTSAAHPFTSAHPGNVIHITGGTGFTTGWYLVYSVSGAVAHLDRICGTVGSTGGTGNLGGAFAKLPDVNATSVLAQGDVVYAKAGSGYTTASQWLVGGSGGDATPISYIGYGTTRGDGIQAIVTATGSVGAGKAVVEFSGQYIIVENLKVDCATLSDIGIQTDDVYCVLINCWGLRGNSTGIAAIGTKNVLYRCKGSSSGGNASGFRGGIYLGSQGLAFACEASGNVENGFASSNAFVSFVRCIAYGNTTNGFFNYDNSGTTMINCVSYNNTGDGLHFDSTFVMNDTLLINNIFANNGGYGIKSVADDYSGTVAALLCQVRMWNNAFFGNTLGTRYKMGAGSGEIITATSPFNSPGSGDFSLNSDPAGGGMLIGKGAGGGFGLLGSNALGSTSYPDIGAVQTTAASLYDPVIMSPAPDTDEVQFPSDISAGATGGPIFNTIVVPGGNGAEQRIAQWQFGRYKWDVSHAMNDLTMAYALISFFSARKGRLRGFRFKDWSDYTATSEVLVLDGSPTARLQKTYSSGGVSYVRPICKPVTGTVTLTRGGSAFAGWSLDYAHGIATWTADSTATVTAITKAANAQVTTSAAHGLSVGQSIYFSGINGMTQLNGVVGVIQTTPTSTTFTIGIDSTSYSTYTSGGTVSKFPQPGESMLWTGQFDVPVRFDTDEMKLQMIDSQIIAWNSVPIIELRGSVFGSI